MISSSDSFLRNPAKTGKRLWVGYLKFGEDDSKLSPETHDTKENAMAFMKRQGLRDEICQQACQIIREVSFSGGLIPSSIEGKCVQDADRLDAIGAIGIAGAF